jgi:hypothetical protein
MKALGNIKTDADGNIKVEEEADEPDDNKSLMEAYQREVQRRGLANGGDDPNNRGRRPPQPAKASRETEMDDNDDPPAPQPTQRRNNPAAAARRIEERGDNLENPHMADAFASLNNIRRNATKEDAQDDQMMAALLERMGD